MHSFRWIGPMAVLRSIGCPVGTEAQPDGASVAKVEFTTLQDYMIVVPVIINGTGPFKFLLDTGTSPSAVTAKLESKLGLPASVMGSTVGLTGTLAVSRVHANTISIGDATVRGLDLTTLPKENGLPTAAIEDRHGRAASDIRIPVGVHKPCAEICNIQSGPMMRATVNVAPRTLNGLASGWVCRYRHRSSPSGMSHKIRAPLPCHLASRTLAQVQPGQVVRMASS
jgi:hypothetical protein